MSTINSSIGLPKQEAFSRLEVAQSFMEELFPQELKEKLNLTDLKRISESFIDGELEEYFSDIIYQTNLTNQETLVSLLFEHKSYTVPFIHIQLLQYVINVWKQEIKDGKTVMLLKHSHDENDEFLKLTPFWLEKIKELDAQQQLDFIRSIFVYIQNDINLTNKEIPTMFTKVSNNVNNIATTIADRIRAEEREITIEYTTFQCIKGMLEKGFEDKLISDVFKLPIF